MLKLLLIPFRSITLPLAIAGKVCKEAFRNSAWLLILAIAFVLSANEVLVEGAGKTYVGELVRNEKQQN